jgi:uracil permease
VAIAIIIAANIWGKGMVKIIPILLGVIGSYLSPSPRPATSATSLA